ncbi:MAG: hypothetical protein KA896_21295 [Leptothrix sp. (in: Bacteria)]|jgi:hypothetical protein|nr:hypothetical protein [Leptothrix sp. (in: b-proteobacteria)]
MTTLTTYPLRLPKSIKAAAEKLSKADGTSLNQFVATAVAEKIAVMETAAFFEERAGRARARATRGEPSALMAILSRADGEPPREGDELPEGHQSLAAPAVKPAAARRRRSTPPTIPPTTAPTNKT